MGFGWFKKQEKKDVLDLRVNTEEKITEPIEYQLSKNGIMVKIPLLSAEDSEKKIAQARTCAEADVPGLEHFVRMEDIVKSLIDITSAGFNSITGETNPNTASEYNEQGLALWRKISYVPDSVYWFHAAAKLEPTRAEPWLNLWFAHGIGARIFGQGGKKDQEEQWLRMADEFFDKARELNPELVRSERISGTFRKYATPPSITQMENEALEKLETITAKLNAVRRNTERATKNMKDFSAGWNF